MTFPKSLQQSQIQAVYYLLYPLKKTVLRCASIDTKFHAIFLLKVQSSTMTVFNIKSVYFCKWSAARSVFALKIVWCSSCTNNNWSKRITSIANKSLVIWQMTWWKMMEQTSMRCTIKLKFKYFCKEKHFKFVERERDVWCGVKWSERKTMMKNNAKIIRMAYTIDDALNWKNVKLYLICC